MTLSMVRSALPLLTLLVLACGETTSSGDSDGSAGTTSGGGGQSAGGGSASSATSGCSAKLSPAVETGVREALSKSDGALSDEELRGVTSLVVRGGTTLSGIECLTALKYLSIMKSTVSEVGLLSRSAHLAHLSLLGTSVADVAPLAELPALEALTLSDSPVTNLSVLAPSKSLSQLHLSHLPATDLAFVSDMPGLTQFSVSHMEVGDVSALASLTNLTELSLEATNVTSVSALPSPKGPPARLDLLDNPLDEAAYATHIPALCEAGWCVRTTQADGAEGQCPEGCVPSK